jgi:hypothetical protein
MVVMEIISVRWTPAGISIGLTGNTLLLDRGTTATRRNVPEIFNGELLFTSPTVMRCTDQTWFNLDPGSEVVVDNGSTLRLESGSRLDVGAGAVLRIKRGSLLEIMDGAALNVADGGNVVIEEGDMPAADGRLLYHKNAIVRLEGTTSELEVAGVLEIGDHATFRIVSTAFPNSTRGRLRFSSTRTHSTNLLAGANSRFVVQSDNQYRRILIVDQESLYGPPELVEFALLTATAQLADGARIVPPVTNSCAIRFEDARVTAPSIQNGHRGVRLNGQRQVVLKQSRFERGAYGLYAFNPTLGYVPFVDECYFGECGTGFYSMAKGVQVSGSTFSQCKTGLLAEQVSLTSELVECTARNSTTGIFLQGTARVLVIDPDFGSNTNGLVIEGVDASVRCGTISDNTLRGMHVKYAATLRMDGSAANPHDPVTAVNNPTTISCLQASNVYLNLGYNSLRPSVTGVGKTLNGTFLCQSYLGQRAYRNNWEGTPYSPLSTSEYAITTNCPMPVAVVFGDPFGAAETACGQAIPPCPEPPCYEPEMDAMVICPSCREVDVIELGEVGLHVASLEAKHLAGNDTLAGNEKQALAIYAQILLSDLEDPSEDEAYLAALGYTGLRESLSDALGKGQLSPSGEDAETDIYLAKVVSVQDRRIQKADPDSLHEMRLFASIDKAQAHRAAGKLDAAAQIFDDVLSWVAMAEAEWVSRLACLTRLERDVVAGTVHWDDVETLSEACAPSPYKSLPAADAAPPAGRAWECPPGIGLEAQWASSRIGGFPEENTRVVITDLAGRVIWQAGFQGQASVPDLFATGTYTYTMQGNGGSFCAGRFAVVR